MIDQLDLFHAKKRKPSSQKEKRTCDHCGAVMVEYRHTFSEALAEGLYRLSKYEGEPTKLASLNLTNNQFNNFQKLRYWDLVSHPSNNGRSGFWKVTALGMEFIKGNKLINKSVWTYRGARTRYEGELIRFSDIHSDYQKRDDFSRESQPHF